MRFFEQDSRGWNKASLLEFCYLERSHADASHPGHVDQFPAASYNGARDGLHSVAVTYLKWYQ